MAVNKDIIFGSDKFLPMPIFKTKPVSV